MGSSPCRRYSLLGVAHPLWDNISGAGCTPVDGAQSRSCCEEGRHVALINIFVESAWNKLVLACILYKRIVIIFFFGLLSI